MEPLELSLEIFKDISFLFLLEVGYLISTGVFGPSLLIYMSDS
jgi:hypothetical protein